MAIAKLYAEAYVKVAQQVFLSLYKKTKQKEAFDIQYKFLHFAQLFLTRLTHSTQEYFEKLAFEKKHKMQLKTVVSQKLGRIQSQN